MTQCHVLATLIIRDKLCSVEHGVCPVLLSWIVEGVSKMMMMLFYLTSLLMSQMISDVDKIMSITHVNKDTHKESMSVYNQWQLEYNEIR